MAESVLKPSQVADAMIARLRQRLDALSPDDPRLKEGLLRIALTIENQAKINIRRQRLVDQGALLNSIKHEFYKKAGELGVSIGSFGVKYAAIHEFGGVIRAKNVRHLAIPLKKPYRYLRPRDVQGLFPLTINGRKFLAKKAGKGLEFAYRLKTEVTISARPYMRPAIKTHQASIVRMVQNLFRGK